MAKGRKKSKDSDGSLYNLGLDKEEDVAFERIAKEKDLTVKQLLRYLMRECITHEGAPPYR
jgi:hypothetical protein